MPFVLRSIAAAVLLVATGAFAHARLQAAEPASGAVVSAPAAVRLHFNEPVEPAVSLVRLFGPGNVAVEVGKPAGVDGDARTLVSTMPKLPAGEYRLVWSTMGHDGHPTRGEMRFTVK